LQDFLVAVSSFLPDTVLIDEVPSGQDVYLKLLLPTSWILSCADWILN